MGTNHQGKPLTYIEHVYPDFTLLGLGWSVVVNQRQQQYQAEPPA